MTVVFSGSRSFPAGNFQSPTFAVNKQLAHAQRIRVLMEAEQFPVGVTSVEIFLSTDGGATFKSASMTVVMPAQFKGPPPHFWMLEWGFLPDQPGTHARYEVTSPSAFTTNVTVETESI